MYTQTWTSTAFITGVLLLSRPDALNASRAYPKGCLRESPSYYDYDGLDFPPNDLVPIRNHDDFALLRRLGAGKFSDVFEAVESRQSINVADPNHILQKDYDPSQLCVIKCLKPVSERKIKRELLVLSHASNLPNLARLKAVVVPQIVDDEYTKTLDNAQSRQSLGSLHQYDGKMPSLVLEHAGQNARWLCHGLARDPTSLSSEQKETINMQQEPFYLTEFEIKYFLCHLLVALDALHQRGIMHRDVKPRNILINRQWPPGSRSKQKINGLAPPPLMLIDLGLADFYLPNQTYNVRVASRHYKAPELLLGNENYDFAIDMWGVGMILGGLILRREPLFRGKDNTDQLGKIVAILGRNDLFKYVEKYGLRLTNDLNKVIRKYSIRYNPSGERKSWTSLLQSDEKKSLQPGLKGDASKNVPSPSAEALDLLDKLLIYDHEERLTAREAMRHPFFDDVREIVAVEIRVRCALEQQQLNRANNLSQ